MSFGRWLLTHSLSLFLVAMLLAAWFWRDELELDRAWAQLRQVGGSMELAASKAGEAPAETAVATASPEADTPVTTTAPEPAPKSSPAAAEPAGSPVVPQAASPATRTEPPGEALPDSDSSEEALLLAARKAFWSRDFDRSIALYQRLVDEKPDNPDYLGELGNIYYNLNRFDRAAELFQRAGRLLVEQGDLARARQLLPALMSLDREKGGSLEQAIERALQAGGGQN